MLALAIVGVIALAAIVVRYVHDGTGGVVLVADVMFALFVTVMDARD
jgi:hypothetical protein